jgi:dTDP-4-dehydrorhamnose reductase
MMGGGPEKDHKFVSHIMNQLANGTKSISAVRDKLGSPTYARDFAACFEALISSTNFGTVHMVSPGQCSRYDVAQAILEILGRDDVTISPVPSSFFHKQFYAPRPTSEIMRNYVLELCGIQTMRPWREALAEYLGEWA